MPVWWGQDGLEGRVEDGEMGKIEKAFRGSKVHIGPGGHNKQFDFTLIKLEDLGGL